MRPADLFTRRLLIYVPAFNCEDTIVTLLQDIPASIRAISDIMVLDNCSTDDTVGQIITAVHEGRLGTDIRVLQTPRNLGYAGSQKVAYALACSCPAVKWIAMLHGDGQYPAVLLKVFEPYLDSDAGIVYGFRSKVRYPRLEETPWLTWAMIRLLSICESVLTGVRRREWHSGFVMHSTRFLRSVDLLSLTSTPHIDGNLLFAAAMVAEHAVPVPIYKLYKRLTAFEGAARRQYVFDVLKLMVTFRKLGQNFIRGTKPFPTPEEVAQGPLRVLL